MSDSPVVLDPVQLTRIEATHRGFLYQHLFGVACLLRAAAAQASSIIVEADEDIEIALNANRLYVQVKTRGRPIIFSDIAGALERFEKIREEHKNGSRPGSCSFRLVTNTHPGQELYQLLRTADWPSDVTLYWPGQPDDAILPRPSIDIPTAFANCRELAAALPFGMLAPDTLVWKLASLVMAAAAGVPPRRDHTFQVNELPALFEQLAIQLQDFPAPPLVYRPQRNEPEIIKDAPVRIITGFSGAGKTAWVAQAAQFNDSELAYFDVGDLPGPAVAIPLARELAGRYFADGGGLGQILLPGATGLEMLRVLARRLQSQGLRPTIVVDNAQRVPSETLREIIGHAPGVRFIFLCQPGQVVQELETFLGLTPEVLQGWTTDTIAAEAADSRCMVTAESAQRLLNLTAGLPLYVQNAVRIASRDYGGDLSRFCNDLDHQTHDVVTAQEIILSKIFEALGHDVQDAVAVLSMSDVPLERGEAAALLKQSIEMDETAFSRLVRELRPTGIIEIFGNNRLKIHDAIRVLGRARLLTFEEHRREVARTSLKNFLLASITKSHDLSKLSLYLRLLGEIGDIKSLVQFATDELFHELGVFQEIEPILEDAAKSDEIDPAQRFSALDGLVFADLKRGDATLAETRLRIMADLVAEHSLDDADRLSVLMKEMNLAALRHDEDRVKEKIEQILQLMPDKPDHRRILKYNAAAALFSLGRYDLCIANTSPLIEEYFSVLGLEQEDVIQRNPHEIFPLLKKGIDHTDDLKHIADTLDLHAKALNGLGRDSGLARIHAMKFYAMANALDSLVRVGQDLADEFVGRNDYIGARDVLERNVLPNVIQHKMVSRIVPVRSQYAVILAYCGDYAAAEEEMRRLAPYEPGLDGEGGEELRRQRNLIRQLRIDRPPPQWEFPQPRRKIGRNEKCYCGSGKKFKHCHGKRA